MHTYELVSMWILLGTLGILAWIDLKVQEVPLEILGVATYVGLMIYIMKKPFSGMSLVGGLLVGGGLLLFSWISRQRIGLGDGLLFCVTGIYYGAWRNLILLTMALVLAVAVGILLMIWKNWDRERRLPLIPFVFLADLLMVLLLL